MWMPTDSRKGEDDHCWMKASRCLSTPLDSPLRPLYWLFRVATTSLMDISCINITGCTIWLEKTLLHHCFHRIQGVIGLTNSNTTWDLTLIGVEWILLIVEKESACAFITKVISTWCSYLSIGTCHDSQHTFPYVIVPSTWHNCNRRPTPHHIRWVSEQSHGECRIDSIAFGHTTQLGELRFPHYQDPTGSDLCINTHWNVVICIMWCCFQIFWQNIVI